MPVKIIKKPAVAEAQAPGPRPPTWDQLPKMLKRGRRFVLWKYVLREGRWTKPPYQRNGFLASVTDPETWAV